MATKTLPVRNHYEAPSMKKADEDALIEFVKRIGPIITACRNDERERRGWIFRVYPRDSRSLVRLRG